MVVSTELVDIQVTIGRGVWVIPITQPFADSTLPPGACDGPTAPGPGGRHCRRQNPGAPAPADIGRCQRSTRWRAIEKVSRHADQLQRQSISARTFEHRRRHRHGALQQVPRRDDAGGLRWREPRRSGVEYSSEMCGEG